MQELDVTEGEAYRDWADALGIPRDLWEHDERTKTVAELSELYGLGDAATRDRVEKALDAGQMVEGKVRGPMGHFVRAFRLAEP